MKSVLSSFISAALICAACGCTPRPCIPVAGTPAPADGTRMERQRNDQPIKGHDGKVVRKGVDAVVGLVHVDIVDLDATAIRSGPDNQIREVDVITTDSKKITLKDVLIDGILYGVAKRQINAPWKIILRDRKHHGIVVATLPAPTSEGRNISIRTEGRDYFDATKDPTNPDVTIYSLNDQKCHGDVNCLEFDSIQIQSAKSHKAVYTCGDRSDQTTCTIEIGMQHYGKQ